MSAAARWPRAGPSRKRIVGPVKQQSLAHAVEGNVRPGDVVHLVCGHSRWSAAARELVRQQWGADPGYTLVMLSLSSLGALFFRGGMVRKVVTAYSGDTFPTYTPNPIFRDAYKSGEVEVEHWSILTFTQRLEAAARGLPAVTTGSLAGSSMAANDAYAEVDSPFGPVGLLAPLVPDVALLHAPVADAAGNVAVAAPFLEGVWGAWAARRGAIVTVEKVVEDLGPWGHLVQLPAHRVLAVAEAPFGAHPGGLFARGLPVEGYGEDIPFWTAARDATRGDFDTWAKHWCLEPATQDEYLERLGTDKLDWLRSRTDPESWRADAEAHPVDEAAPVTGWETAAAVAARELVARIDTLGADAVLAGAGVANLAAWVGVARARGEGRDVCLTAELGLWGYTPTPADPYIFNHRVFPGSSMLTDATRVLGMVIGGPGTVSIGCLGAAQATRRSSPAARSSSARAAETMSRAAPTSASSSRLPAPNVCPRRSATSPAPAGGWRRWSPTSASCASATASCGSRRCRRAATRWTNGCAPCARHAAGTCRWTGRSRSSHR
ncbi:MAG: hypothetical protein E6G17_13490 [Actinobacteria bacterium]|nr:MAG: hypothetical protein E6G17_13490 [Actinomycetota bacterium]